MGRNLYDKLSIRTIFLLIINMTWIFVGTLKFPGLGEWVVEDWFVLLGVFFHIAYSLTFYRLRRKMAKPKRAVQLF
jgi:hypothetical protein